MILTQSSRLRYLCIPQRVTVKTPATSPNKQDCKDKVNKNRISYSQNQKKISKWEAGWNMAIKLKKKARQLKSIWARSKSITKDKER